MSFFQDRLLEYLDEEEPEMPKADEDEVKLTTSRNTMNGNSTVLEHKRESKEEERSHCHSSWHALRTFPIPKHLRIFCAIPVRHLPERPRMRGDPPLPAPRGLQEVLHQDHQDGGGDQAAAAGVRRICFCYKFS